jgi:hypothetical protein
VNNEELEVSLRTEFESHLNDVLAEIREQVSSFQKNVETEFEKHRSMMDQAISDLAAKLEASPSLGPALSESVAEHLRLAKDAGAEIAATAFDKAEKLRTEEVTESRYDLLRNALNDISSKKSQSSILSSLIEHAANFAARGTFFIIKNEQFSVWKAFGGHLPDGSAGDAHHSFSLSKPTVLARAVETLATAEASYADDSPDSEFVEAIGFARPETMYAIPLVARGKGVAVLYADRDHEGHPPNLDALEMLVRVAGLTVELQAATQTLAVAQDSQAITSKEMADEGEGSVPEIEPQPEAAAVAELAVEAVVTDEPMVFADEVIDDATGETEAAEFEMGSIASIETSESDEILYGDDISSDEDPGIEPNPEPAVIVNELRESKPSESRPEQPRLRDRFLDLPIEVPEEERRLHNDARRFARLLVSEIKLYNEQKVAEGRDAGDLYDRLREAIDRSREMYDKRVQPAVSEKFDYFDYELINNLADGKAETLGASFEKAVV